MKNRSFALLYAALLTPLGVQAAPPVAPAVAALSYADLADLAVPAPVVATATITKAQKLSAEESPGLAPGKVRFYVFAKVDGLLRGASGLPAEVSYLVDLPLDARGKAPKLRNQRVILFASVAGGRPGEIRLTTQDGQVAWTAEAEATLRKILTEALGSKAPPVVTRVGNAFHVPGTLPGEGETQVFLQTADSRPVSLSILRRPDEQPRFAVALGELVDEAAGPPQRDTLLWYRLACTLPQNLPLTSTANLSADEAELARADYQVVIRALGPCVRTRAAR